MSTSAHAEAPSTDFRIYLILFLAAVGARALFFLFMDEPGLFLKYTFFAEKLAGGEDIGERLTDLSPFYLYFMTFLKKTINLDWAYVKVIQSFVGVLNCLLLYAIGARAFRREVGFLAALLYSFYGNLIILESTLEPMVFVLLFNLLVIYLLIRVGGDSAASNRTMAIAAGAGFLAGLSIITKPNALLLLPLGAVWILLPRNRKTGRGRRLSAALLFCFIALLVVLPVTVRNYVKLNEFILVTADGGKVFFHGNARGATALEGTGLPDEGFAEEGTGEPDYAHVLYRKTAAKLSGKKLSPSESSKFWSRRTLDDIFSDPLAYVRLEAKKVFYFFNNYEMHYLVGAYREYKASLSFPFVRYGIISSLGLLGMILSIRKFKDLWLFYGMVFMYLLSGMLFLVQSRYRTPAVPYLCLFAGYGIFALKEMALDKRLKSLAATLVLAGMFFALTHLVYRQEIHAVDQWQAATKIHYQGGAQPLFRMGRYEEAVSELNKCLSIITDFSPALNLRGKCLAILGKHEAALADFKRVISLSPNLPEGYKNTGFTYLLIDDKLAARVYLEKAEALAPNDSKVTEALAQLR